MDQSHPVDASLAPLTRSFFRYAEELLDLREALLQRQHPGACVQCYFKLHGASSGDREALETLRRFLEQQLEIVVSDSSERELETWPLRFDGEPDLASLCRRAMREVQLDRAYSSAKVVLRFRYKPPTSGRAAA